MVCVGDLVGVQDHASPDHAVNVPCMPDIALRIGVQDQQIGAFSRFESAQIGSAAHGAGAALSRGLEDRHRSKSGLGHALQLSVQCGSVQGADVDGIPIYTPEPGCQEAILDPWSGLSPVTDIDFHQRPDR
jgi:hypothetical protein